MGQGSVRYSISIRLTAFFRREENEGLYNRYCAREGGFRIHFFGILSLRHLAMVLWNLQSALAFFFRNFRNVSGFVTQPLHF